MFLQIYNIMNLSRIDELNVACTGMWHLRLRSVGHICEHFLPEWLLPTLIPFASRTKYTPMT
jgi:hypothetical protein